MRDGVNDRGAVVHDGRPVGGAWWAVVVAAASFAVLVRAQVPTATRPAATQPASAPAVRFAAVDVCIDAGDKALAAYQFELAARVGDVAIVGIEGGEHPAFAEPPYYDPAALRNNRVIIGALNTGRDLPTGRTRVARLHLQITGDQVPEYAAELSVAASADGRRITARISVVEGEDR